MSAVFRHSRLFFPGLLQQIRRRLSVKRQAARHRAVVKQSIVRRIAFVPCPHCLVITRLGFNPAMVKAQLVGIAVAVFQNLFQPVFVAMLDNVVQPLVFFKIDRRRIVVAHALKLVIASAAVVAVGAVPVEDTRNPLEHFHSSTCSTGMCIFLRQFG